MRNISTKSLIVYDFDDTLVRTDCVVKVLGPTGEKLLDPGTFNQYVPKKGETFCFDQFAQVINPRLLRHFYQFKKDVEHNKKVFVLTSRDKRSPIRKYLSSVGINTDKVAVIALGSSDPEDKATWIYKKATKYVFNEIYFADDSIKNIKAVDRRLRDTEKRVTLDYVESV